MTNEEAVSRLAEVGAICVFTLEDEKLLDGLVGAGIAIQCAAIDHHAYMLNPEYTYVSNDDKGRALAVKYPLFTILTGHSAIASRNELFGRGG